METDARQDGLRFDSVVRKRGGSEELAQAFGTCSHRWDLAFMQHDDEAAAFRRVGNPVINSLSDRDGGSAKQSVKLLCD